MIFIKYGIFMTKAKKLKKSVNSKIHYIDTIVGQRLAQKRKCLGMSQQDLAKAAGVSIQQIQKYEKSTNRITSGKLYEFSKTLDVSIQYFFTEFQEPEPIVQEKKQTHFAEDQKDYIIDSSILDLDDIKALMLYYKQIKDKNVKQKLLDLMRVLGQSIVNKYV